MVLWNKKRSEKTRKGLTSKEVSYINGLLLGFPPLSLADDFEEDHTCCDRNIERANRTGGGNRDEKIAALAC